MNYTMRRRVQEASARVLRRKSSSKAAVMEANGFPHADSHWLTRRRAPYTENGIKRLKCIRCGNPAEFQWQICADGNNYRPLCGLCDILLNKTVLIFMKHPDAEKLIDEYTLKKANDHNDHNSMGRKNSGG